MIINIFLIFNLLSVFVIDSFAFFPNILEFRSEDLITDMIFLILKMPNHAFNLIMVRNAEIIVVKYHPVNIHIMAYREILFPCNNCWVKCLYQNCLTLTWWEKSSATCWRLIWHLIFQMLWSVCTLNRGWFFRWGS